MCLYHCCAECDWNRQVLDSHSIVNKGTHRGKRPFYSHLLEWFVQFDKVETKESHYTLEAHLNKFEWHIWRALCCLTSVKTLEHSYHWFNDAIT
jgi:hypothetical protein